MKLIHVKVARSVWLFDVQDLNPRGREFTNDLVAWIRNSYNFAVIPDVREVKAKAGSSDAIGLIFKRGRFQVKEDSVIELVSLAIHNDGIVVETTSSTEEADYFAGEFLRSASKEFGLSYEPEIVRKHLYVSALIFYSASLSFAGVNPAIAAFAGNISRAFGTTAPSGAFHFSHIGFWTEPNDGGVHKTFTIAPQAGKPLSEHRYFSEAPLKTEDHLRLLGELEQALTRP